MRCPNCQNEMREKEDFIMLRLHPKNQGEFILKCIICESEISVKQVVAYEPVNIYRRAEDQLKKAGC